ncbi:tRNA 2'-phosphotransferase 1 isoform X3 [Pelodiscus sinensis]|uniref:tRNA 2'-phosphotransferase 1 isoform X3 n=1 Tax=Pelodiscus sinensis TaxID=13735 RepID=UPI003F6AF8F7
MDPGRGESPQPLPGALGRGGRKPRSRKRHQDQNPEVRLSKALSYVLRHGAAQLGLEMSADGFVDVASVLSLPRFRGVSVADVQRVVETNEKRRFALRPHPGDGHLQIRANQGHSLQQVSELELTPLLEPTDLPQTMAHGTYLRHWPAICQGGLSRMGRNHIHLAPGLPGDGHVLSGMRQDCDVAIVIDGPKALAAFPENHASLDVTPVSWFLWLCACVLLPLQMGSSSIALLMELSSRRVMLKVSCLPSTSKASCSSGLTGVCYPSRDPHWVGPSSRAMTWRRIRVGESNIKNSILPSAAASSTISLLGLPHLTPSPYTQLGQGVLAGDLCPLLP